jgi:O-antigen/teichoic acid export membrane protein
MSPEQQGLEKKNLRSENVNIKVGIIISYVSLVVSVIVNFFFQKYIYRTAGDKQWDLYSWSASIAEMLTILNFGLSSAYIRFATIAKKKNGENGEKQINSLYLLIFMVGASLVLLVGGIILLVFKYAPPEKFLSYSDDQQKLIFVLLAFSIVNTATTLFSNAFSLFITYKGRFIWLRSISLMGVILIPCMSVLLMSKNPNIALYSAAQIAVNALMMVCNILFCVFALKYKTCLKFNKDDWATLKEMAVFCIYIFIMGIVTQLNSQIAKTLLGIYEKPNDPYVGYYQDGWSFLNYINVLVGAITSTYAPRINKLVIDSDDNGTNQLFLKISKEQSVVYMFIFGGFVACGKDFVGLWLADEKPERIVIYYIAVVFFFIFIVPYTTGSSSEIQRAKNKHKVRAWVLLGGALLSCLMTWISLLVISKKIQQDDPNLYIYQYAACLGSVAISTWLSDVIIMNIYNKKVIKLDIKKYLLNLLVTFIPFVLALFVVHLVFYKLVDISGLSSLIRMLIRGGTYVACFTVFFSIVYKKDITEKLTEFKMARKNRISPAVSVPSNDGNNENKEER